MKSSFKTKTKEIMELYKSSDDVVTGATFVSSLFPKKNINISNTDMTNFFSDLLEITSQSNNEIIKSGVRIEDPRTEGLFFAEKIETHSPIFIDMDFSFNDSEAVTFYEADFIINITKTIQNIISDMLGNEIDKDKTLTCFVLESKVWFDDETKTQKQKIRFHFPYSCVPPAVISGWIIPELILDLSPLDLFKTMHSTPIIANWEDIILKPGNFLPMYGSKFCEKTAPLMFRCVFTSIIDYDVSQREITNEFVEDYCVVLNDEDWIDPMDHHMISALSMLDANDFYENDKMFNLPLILSVNFQCAYTKIKSNSIMITDIKKPAIKKKETGFLSVFDDEVQIYDELVELLSPEKLSEESKYTWYDVGRVTHNVFNGSNLGLEKFKQISHPKLKGQCEEVWETMCNEFLDKRTLMAFIEEDYPEKLEEWATTSYYNKFIEPAIRGKNMVLADLVSRIPKICLSFAYDRESKIWMRFKHSRMLKDTGACELREMIRSVLKEIFFKVQREREIVRDEETVPARRKELNRQVREVDSLLEDKLDDVDFLDKIIKALKSKMFDDNLSSKGDENMNLIACTNVVLECYDETICYRKGKLQDYISKSTNIAFPISYNLDTKSVRFILKYYSQVHCEPQLYYPENDHCKYCKSSFHDEGICHGEMCEFILTDNASFLLGGNEEKRFRNLIGESNASKSQEVKLWQEALGDYCVDFPNEAITVCRTKSSGGPDPALEQAKGARIAVVAETDRSEPLHVGKIKKYTGNDRYWNRSLNKEGGSRALSFKLIHMSNLIPRPANPDEAYEMREILYMHLSKWCDNPPDDPIEQFRQRRFKKDISFPKNLKRYAQAQLWLMYKYFPIYKKNGLANLPELVKIKTEEHQKEINPYYNFIKEKLEPKYIESEGEKIPDTNETLCLNKVFQLYSRWLRTFSPDCMINIDQTAFKTEMIRKERLGPMNKYNAWEGLTIRGIEARGQ